MTRTMPQVMVLSSEGYLYLYSIDFEKGGECSLIKQYKYATIISARNSADLNSLLDSEDLLLSLGDGVA